MAHFISSLPLPVPALAATTMTWLMTALGAAAVIFIKNAGRSFYDCALGAAAGVMTAASFWSLLKPAEEGALLLGISPALPVTLGFISGGALLMLCDRFIAGRIGSAKRRSVLLVLSITLHNIPEGLAVGVAFGSLAFGSDECAAAAWGLALGIGLQNIPEGTAVSMPLMREGCSRRKAFTVGQLSGIVEPCAGVAGALLVMGMRSLMPFLLAFAAGAMVYVVFSELIPESRACGSTKATAFALSGFALMTLLDVALG